MKYIFLFFVLLMLFPAVHAEDEVLKSRKAELQFDMDGSVNVDFKGSYSQVNYVETYLYWYPVNSITQEVLEVSPSDDAEYINNTLLYRWVKPEEGPLLFSLQAKVLTNSDFVKVKKYTKFPIEDLGEEYIEFTQAEDIIDINDDIREVASKVASGKDDLYQVVFDLAEYSRNNIEYDLSTVTVEASQKASWVLENKKGVCDELTSLFISMVRSLGIPAKFVSGVSYTNLDSFDTNWQAHGWAEVYFPDVGWVPFDVTYGEYGWLDASHIKLRETIDAERTAAEFHSKGKNFKLIPGALSTKGKVISAVGRPLPSANIKVEPLWNGVSFGSFNVIKVSLENPYDYYVSDSFRFARVAEMSFFLPESNHFLLKPLERKELRFLVEVGEDLDDNKYYAFPLQLVTDREVKAANSFRVEPRGTYYSREEAEMYLNNNLETKGFGNLLCTPDKANIYKGETVTIKCSTSEENVKICFDGTCKNSDSGADFYYRASAGGFRTMKAEMLRNEELLGSSFFSIDTLTPAEIKVVELGSEDLEYSDKKVPITFVFSNNVTITNLNISIQHSNFNIDQSLYDLEPNTHELNYYVSTSDFLPGNNELKFLLVFTDRGGSVYTQEESDTVQLNGSPWHHKLYGWFSRTWGKIF